MAKPNGNFSLYDKDNSYFAQTKYYQRHKKLNTGRVNKMSECDRLWVGCTSAVELLPVMS